MAVLEAGRRFDIPSGDAPRTRHEALPRTSWHARRYLWAPLGLWPKGYVIKTLRAVYWDA